MKIYRLMAAAIFAAAITVAPAFAQTKPAAPATQPAPTQSAGTVPDSKIAVIYSNAFLDPKTGIARFNTLVATLNREFQPRQTELNQLQERIKTSTDEINKLQGSSVPVDPKSLASKAEALEQLKKEYQRKGEDAEALYQKRQQEIFAPLQNDIEKALEAYAKQRGITVIIDASRVPMVYAADSIDITRPFIADFNSKNPATASVTPPK
jgi:Skp family chaperone for outer membrane proteins